MGKYADNKLLSSLQKLKIIFRNISGVHTITFVYKKKYLIYYIINFKYLLELISYKLFVQSYRLSKVNLSNVCLGKLINFFMFERVLTWKIVGVFHY